ncbi:MAG: hemerythrin domain-containing protein [Aigarchaeota archaeon]|nr:hemerythrin domain-containing protein [Aigarchaeota archaeon]MCX8192617.1 hemerythrin domain-containing protein [Nitrososphaeria archaeon]MDW7985647.1 hemerythrin domain-containing protein [Nitrososphaerota archaeon]
MFLKPTDILKDEHVEIKRMLTILNIIIEKINYGEKISPEVLEKIINFFRIFTDRCHHWKEEKILFPSLEEVGIPRYGGPIGVMLMEHEEGRRYVKNMVEAVEKYRRGLEDALGEFKENAVNYVALLDQHIYKEDNILFNLADQHIPLSRQEEIMHSFKEFEERESKGEHEKQLQILKRLEVEYLRE